MRTLRNLPRVFMAGILPMWVLVSAVVAQTPGNGPPAVRAVEQTASLQAQAGAAAIPDHALKPSLERAHAALAKAKTVRDYAYTFVKREVVNGKLTEHEAIFMKIRH